MLAWWWLQIDAGRCWASFLHPCEAEDRCRDDVDGLVEKMDVPLSAGAAAASAERVEEGVVDLIWWPRSAGDLDGEQLLLTSEPYYPTTNLRLQP
jgi:hypothetical protein